MEKIFDEIRKHRHTYKRIPTNRSRQGEDKQEIKKLVEAYQQAPFDNGQQPGP